MKGDMNCLMADRAYLDLSDVIETFDLEETRRLLDSQLEALHDDVCEGMIDNFKILYQRYASIRDNEGMQNPDVVDEAQEAFFNICDMFVTRIGEEFDFTVDDAYRDTHYQDIPSLALTFYLFFVLDLRSNLYNVLLTYISKNMDVVVTQFEELRSRKDSISEVNRKLEDQNVALVASNIYDVVDWVMDNIDPEEYFSCMEPDYVALAPVKKMFDDGIMNGNFVESIRDILKENISMKGRVCFDIVCRLKGYKLT